MKKISLAKKNYRGLNLARKILDDETPIHYPNDWSDNYLNNLTELARHSGKIALLIGLRYREKKIEETLEDIETYNGHYSCDVKIRDFSGVDDAIDALNAGEKMGFSTRNFKRNPITEKQTEWLNEIFDDTYISNEWGFWIDLEREYLLDWIKEDYPRFDLTESGFDGRSGGHFVLCKKIVMEDYCCSDVLYDFFIDGDMWYDGRIQQYNLGSFIDNVYDYQDDLLKKIEDIKAVLDKVHKFAKSMSFKENLMYRIEEKFTEELDEYKEWKLDNI